MLQAGEVDISKSQRLIKKINEDPAFIAYENEIAQLIHNDRNYLKKSFDFEYGKGIQLGGKRAEGAMLQQFKNPFSSKYKDTWKVAANELTWLLRSIGVKSKITVFANGNIVINHKFQDVFDLRPSDNGSRSIEYDAVSIVTGFLYHDIAGGNDLMKIKGNWNNNYSKSQLEWMLKTPEEKGKSLEEAMKKINEQMKNKNDSLKRNMDEIDFWNRTSW